MAGIMMLHMSHKREANVAATTMRALLSVSGQTAYDAAANNAWFNVSNTDYAAVFSGLSGTSKIGMNDATLGGGGQAFVGQLGSTLPQANATVPSGNYVIGFATKQATSATATVSPYISTTFKGTYSTLGSNIVTLPASAGIVYFLRKAPTPEASTSYIAMGPKNTGNWWATGSWTAGGAYSSNMSSWTNYTGNLPCQQWLITSSQPY